MSKSNELLSLLNLVEDAGDNVNLYKDSLSKVMSPPHMKAIIKAAMAKGDKFAVKMGLMKLNKEKALDPKDYNALLNYMDELDKKPAASTTKSKSFLSRFF
jgi:uncharacterized membrane protein YvbJ